LAEEELDVFDAALMDDPVLDDAAIDTLEPDIPVRAHRGQISGTPEDGESLFTVEE
jgi:hypothetical protein